VLAALASLDDFEAEFMPFLKPAGIAPEIAKTLGGNEESDSVQNTPEGNPHPGRTGEANNLIR
jgi:hypothetical protein